MKKILLSLFFLIMICSYTFSQKREVTGLQDGVSYAIDSYGNNGAPYWKIEFGNAAGKMRHVHCDVDFTAGGGYIKTEHYEFDLTDTGGYEGYSLGPLYVPKGYANCSIIIKKLTITEIKR